MNGFTRIMDSIIKGDFLTVIRAEKNISFIAYCFVLIFAYISINLLIEESMLRRKQNEGEIYSLKVLSILEENKLIGLDYRDAVESKLKRLGSELVPPEKAPAEIEPQK